MFKVDDDCAPDTTNSADKTSISAPREDFDFRREFSNKQLTRTEGSVQQQTTSNRDVAAAASSSWDARTDHFAASSPSPTANFQSFDQSHSFGLSRYRHQSSAAASSSARLQPPPSSSSSIAPAPPTASASSGHLNPAHSPMSSHSSASAAGSLRVRPAAATTNYTTFAAPRRSTPHYQPQQHSYFPPGPDIYSDIPELRSAAIDSLMVQNGLPNMQMFHRTNDSENPDGYDGVRGYLHGLVDEVVCMRRSMAADYAALLGGADVHDCPALKANLLRHMRNTHLPPHPGDHHLDADSQNHVSDDVLWSVGCSVNWDLERAHEHLHAFPPCSHGAFLPVTQTPHQQQQQQHQYPPPLGPTDTNRTSIIPFGVSSPAAAAEAPLADAAVTGTRFQFDDATIERLATSSTSTSGPPHQKSATPPLPQSPSGRLVVDDATMERLASAAACVYPTSRRPRVQDHMQSFPAPFASRPGAKTAAAKPKAQKQKQQQSKSQAHAHRKSPTFPTSASAASFRSGSQANQNRGDFSSASTTTKSSKAGVLAPFKRGVRVPPTIPESDERQQVDDVDDVSSANVMKAEEFAESKNPAPAMNGGRFKSFCGASFESAKKRAEATLQEVAKKKKEKKEEERAAMEKEQKRLEAVKKKERAEFEKKEFKNNCNN